MSKTVSPNPIMFILTQISTQLLSEIQSNGKGFKALRGRIRKFIVGLGQDLGCGRDGTWLGTVGYHPKSYLGKAETHNSCRMVGQPCIK